MELVFIYSTLVELLKRGYLDGVDAYEACASLLPHTTGPVERYLCLGSTVTRKRVHIGIKQWWAPVTLYSVVDLGERDETIFNPFNVWSIDDYCRQLRAHKFKPLERITVVSVERGELLNYTGTLRTRTGRVIDLPVISPWFHARLFADLLFEHYGAVAGWGPTRYQAIEYREMVRIFDHIWSRCLLPKTGAGEPNPPVRLEGYLREQMLSTLNRLSE